MEAGISARRTQSVKPTRVRYFILFLVCAMTAVNYMGRTNIAVAAPYIVQDLGLTPAMMGLVFSAFAWTYTLMQLPTGWILDRFGSRIVYSVSMLLWSSLIAAIGWAADLTMLVICRLCLGICGAPTFPANSRVVTAWFPTKERGLAVGGYIGAQHIGLAFLTPAFTWIIVSFGWSYIFIITGIAGMGLACLWWFLYRDPARCRQANALELAYVREGGGFCDAIDEGTHPAWKDICQLFQYRQLWGMWIGNFTIASTAYFFITWFPSYLVNAKGLTLLDAGLYASAPFLAALVGVAVGGKWSDWMLAHGYSLGTARKTPVITGLLCSCCIAGANYTDQIWFITAIMSFAFFGQNIANTCGWALVSDVAPRELIGVTGGLYNLSSNVGGIVTPMVIGFIVEITKSYQWALVFVSAVALLGALSYLFIIGKPYRIEIQSR